MMHPIPSSPTHCSKSVATHCGNNVSSSCVHMIADIVCLIYVCIQPVVDFLQITLQIVFV